MYDRKGVLDPVVELIDQNALVFFKGHFFCYIVALNQNAFEVVSTVDRLVDELEKPGLKFSILARIQEDPFFLAEVWFVFVEHFVEQLDEPLIDNFRQCLRHRFANQLALTDKLTIRSIRHYKSMISSTQHRYEPGCLFEQGTESIQFLAGPPITFLHRFGAPGDAGSVALRARLLQSRDANRMLENIFDIAILIEKRRVSGAPYMGVKAALGVWNIIRDSSDFVSIAGLEDSIERRLQLAITFTFAREGFKNSALLDLVPLAFRGAQIGCICPLNDQRCIENNVGVGRARKHTLEI